MEKTTLKQSYINMAQLIKKSNGKFFTALILVLVPVLIICCYSFYAVYGGTGLNYSALESIDFNGILSGSTDAVISFQEAIYKVFPDVTYEQGFGDIVLDVLDMVLIVLVDAFFTLLATSLIFEKNYPDSVLFKEAFKKIPTVLFLSILASWLIYEVESIIYSSIFMIFSSVYMGSEIFMYSSIISTVVILAFCILLSCWLLLFVRYMAISTVSGRCRFMLALGYAREVLRGKVWRQMFRIMPFVIVGFIMPFIIQSVAIALANNVTLSVILIALCTLIQMVAFAYMWIYTVPEFFNNEKESGIQQKIQEMLSKAMNMRKTNENEDTNSNDDAEKE